MHDRWRNAILGWISDTVCNHPKTVLLHVPNWRTDPYDENYPTYVASEKAKAFIAKGRDMGFHMMPHFNSIDMDPSHPAYAYVRDFQYRGIERRDLRGWSWYQGRGLGVPESNAAEAALVTRTCTRISEWAGRTPPMPSGSRTSRSGLKHSNVAR